MAISEELELDISGALASIEDLRGSIETLSDTFTISINDAIGAVDVTPLTQNITEAAADADVAGAVSTDIESVDTSPLTSGLDEAVAGADLGGSIDEALASADVVIPIEADTSAIGDSIDEAVESADAVVPIEADASSVSDAIDEEVGSANTEIELSVADDGGIADATTQLEALGDGSNAANDSIGALTEGSVGLSSQFGKLGVVGAAAGAGLGLLFQSGVKVEGSFQRLEHVTGKYAKQLQSVRIGDFEASFSELSKLVGSSGTALREVTATTFDFAKSSGLAGKEAAAFANNINGIAVAVSTADPGLGSVAEVAEKLPKALARGGPAAAKFGLDIQKADIAARAAANAIKGVGDGTSTAALQFAGAQLAAEKLGKKGLKESIEEGAKNPIIQMRVLETTVKGFIAAAAAPLVAPGLEFFKESGPAFEAVARAIGEVALAALPSLTAGLQVAGVALQGLASIIEVIPDPILQAATALFLFNKAQSVLAATKIGAAFGAMGVQAAAAARGIAGTSAAAAQGTIATRAFATAQVGASSALAKIRAVATPTNVALLALAAGYFIAQQRQADLAKDGQALAAALDKGGAAAKRARQEIQELNENAFAGGDDGFLGFLQKTFAPGTAIEDTKTKLEALNKAQKELTGTQGFAQRQAQALADAEDHYRDVVAKFGPESDKAAAALAKVNRLRDDSSVSTTAASKALEDNTALTAEAIAEQEALASRLRLGEAGFDRLGVSIARGEIPAASFGAVAKNLGISVEDLGTIVEAVEGQIQAFADTVTSALPGLSDVFSDLGSPQDLFKGLDDAIADREKAIGDATLARQKLAESGTADAQAIADADADVVTAIAEGDQKVADAQKALFDSVDPEVFLAKLQAQAKSIADFQTNLATLVSRGFGNLAANLAQQGPVVAGGITEALTRAEPATLQSLNSLFTNTGLKAAEDFRGFAVSTFGPIVADGGKAATDQFGIAFNPAAAAGAATALVPAAIVAQTDPIILAAQSVGFQLTEAFKGQVIRVPTVVAQSMIDAGIAVQVNKTSPLAEADRAGAEMTIRFTQAYDPATPAGRRTAAAGDAVKAQKPKLRRDGKETGQSLMEGIIEGLDSFVGRLGKALGGIGNFITGSLGRVLGIGSPATVMIPLGRAVSEGLAVGVLSGISDVDAALATLSKQTFEQFNAKVVPLIEPVQLAPAVAAALPVSARPAAATTAGFTASAQADLQGAGSGVHIGQLVVQTTAPNQVQVGIEVARQLRAESFRVGR